MNETICLAYKGKVYEMTEEQIEAAYEYRKRQFLLDDAKRQLDDYIYGCDPDALSKWDKQFQDAVFLERNGFEPEVAYAKLEEIVRWYEQNGDCNVDENSAWQSAICDVLNEHKRN